MKSVFVSSNYHNANVKPLDFLHLVSQTLVNLTLVSPLASASLRTESACINRLIDTSVTLLLHLLNSETS